MPTTTAEEYLQPLLPGLVPVPAVQPGVCSICRTAAKDGYNDCYRCAGQTVSVVPISLSIHGELLHHHLRHYKDNPHADVRQKLTIRLVALIELFLRHHLDSCLGGPVHRVATVPSQRRDAPWGIIRCLGRFAGQTNPLTYQPEQGFVATANPQAQRAPTSRRHLHLRPGPLRRSPGTHRRRSRSCRTSCNWPPRPTRLATERRTIPAPQIHAVVCDKMLPLRRRRLRPTPTRQADITIRQLTPANRPTTSTPHRPGIVPCPSLASGGGRRNHGYRRDTLLSSSSITPHTTPPNQAPRCTRPSGC